VFNSLIVKMQDSHVACLQKILWRSPVLIVQLGYTFGLVIIESLK
jgi:hypothetical protein